MNGWINEWVNSDNKYLFIKLILWSPIFVRGEGGGQLGKQNVWKATWQFYWNLKDCLTFENTFNTIIFEFVTNWREFFN